MSLSKYARILELLYFANKALSNSTATHKNRQKNDHFAHRFSFGFLAFALFFALMFSLPLHAANVVKNVEIFKRTDRIDLLFTFENSFNENISQRDGAGYRTVIFKNSQYGGRLDESINALGVEVIKVFEQDGDLYLMVIGAKTPSITASKTANGFGLRIRIKELEVPKITAMQKEPVRNNALSANLSQANMREQNDTKDSTPSNLKSDDIARGGVFSHLGMGVFSQRQYLFMIGAMIAILLLLLFLRRKSLSGMQNSGWLFGQKRRNSSDIEIISQKPLDIKNRFVTIESGGFRYLILIGQNGNTLIDRYQIAPKKERREYIEGEETFEELLEQKRDNLLNYLGENRKLDEFKERARRY